MGFEVFGLNRRDVSDAQTDLEGKPNCFRQELRNSGHEANSIFHSSLWLINSSHDQLLTYVIFTAWLFYAIAAACILCTGDVYRMSRTGGLSEPPGVFTFR